MTPAELIARREGDWKRLAALVEGPARRGIAPEEAPLMARLYRQSLADLARLRTLTAAASARADDDSPAVAWLNALVARAHGRLQVTEPLGRGRVVAFFARDFPRRFRASLPRTALAAALLFASAAVSYGLAAGDVSTARALAGPALAENAESFAHVGEGRSAAADAASSSFYVTNNTRVAFMAFALGITAGVGTIYVMIGNGIALGTTLALAGHFGSTGNLLAFIVSHGPIELLAIFVAAGAGLGMGHALVAPGPWRRAVALRRAALEASTLVMGAAALLGVAAFFEAFVSPSSLPPAAKVLIGAGNTVWLALYLGRAGRHA